ncbi:TetR family transcriptional regulator [Parvularcula dongshanensis]|uniref:TetR/AcrR family transcriptional repressor of nem operon n=1 Tax=Parvularcula dongshanensis TaxID=1173995 RepID=A0A840I754_9PROT|nr:TetR/AcrR family transcriptional repressor of nem operon [Parvularcula dongshanensis]
MTSTLPSPPDARSALLGAATRLIRERGYAATSVNDLCREAGVSKGAFFHHFASKDELAVEAAKNWSAVTGALFREADYHLHERAADRVFAYLDLREDLLAGAVSEFTCLAGTLVQEAHGEDAIRAACAESILGHAATLESDIAQALADAGVPHSVTAQSLARHTQAVLQGAFILAKAEGDAAPVREGIGHLRQYLTTLFTPSAERSAP